MEYRFELSADVSSDDPGAIEPVLRELIEGAISKRTDGFHIEATMTGSNGHRMVPRAGPRDGSVLR